MLDIAVAYNRFKFLGFEFLTWLWFLIDTDADEIPEIRKFSIGNRIVLENRHDNNVETLTIKGDDAGLEEGLVALKKGGLVTQINLVYREGQNNKWQFSLNGENLAVQQIKHPDIGSIESSEDVDAFVFEKAHHYNKIIELIDMIFSEFITLRISDAWSADVVIKMKKWIT